MTDSIRTRIRTLTRVLESEGDPARRKGLQLERALMAGDLAGLLDAIGDAHPDAVHVYPTGEVLIHFAIGMAPPHLVQALVKLRADVNYVATDGFRALVNAIHHKEDPTQRRELVQALIDAGGDLERVGINGWWPLHVAALTDDPQLVRMLLQAGPDPHSRTTMDDCGTVIAEAEQFGALRGADAIRQWLAEQL